VDRLHQEVALLKEEIRIKDGRMERLPPQRRPHYPPIERLAILELRAARGWTVAETARRLLVTPLTVASWNSRLDEQGPDALAQVPVPVNRFPEFVGYVVRRLRALCPSMGTRRIAQVLARAGLHLGRTHGAPHAPADAQATEAERGSESGPHDHRARTKPRLARGSHNRANWLRVLDSVAALRPASELAVLLVGGRRGGPLLQACRRHRGVRE
jgi:transposase-like protein